MAKAFIECIRADLEGDKRVRIRVDAITAVREDKPRANQKGGNDLEVITIAADGLTYLVAGETLNGLWKKLQLANDGPMPAFGDNGVNVVPK